MKSEIWNFYYYIMKNNKQTWIENSHTTIATIIISIKLISHHVSIIYSYFLPNTTLCRHHHSINHETGKKIWLPVIYEANYVKNRIPIENVIMAKTIIKRFWIKKILNNSTFIITINFISRHQSINFTHSIAPFVRKSIYFFFLFK